MADLGDLIGSMMSGLLKARRIADEHTAALAEYYKENPLLEGLSIPRIRIPEITIDFPAIIENQSDDESGVMEEPEKIQKEIEKQLKTTLETNNIKTEATFNRLFIAGVSKQLSEIKSSGTPVVKESLSRGVQQAFAEALKRSNTQLSTEEKTLITHELRSVVSKTSMVKRPVSAGIISNIRTSDVKEHATPNTAARIKITLREEGLEWTTQATDSGGVNRTLQPE